MMSDNSMQKSQRSMTTSQSTGKSIDPILFIDIDESGQFLISKKAVQYIKSIETSIAVVTIVGSYRTGKSFLLNRFVGCQKGFDLGPSTNPCTKGIWIWGESIPQDNLTILYLDTEGLNSYERDQDNDAKLLVLACIISSTIIYNVMGVIDERTLETLSFTTNISKHLLGTEEFITQYLPNFIWVIRDFSLNLNGKSTDQYMENCLALLEGDTQEIIQKNEIRIALNKYFRKRSCFTLVRPVNDEQQLRYLDRVEYNELRSEFRMEVEELIKSVYSNLQPKIYKNTPINGERLIDLVSTYVLSINQNSVPNIENVWDRIISKEYKRMMERVDQIMKQEIQLPLQVEQLFNELNMKYSQSLEEIMNYKISEYKKLDGIQQLGKMIKEKAETLENENRLRSKKINSTIANKMFDVVNTLSDQNKLQNVNQVILQIPNLKKIFYSEAKPPSNHESYNQLLELIIQVIEKVYNSNVIQFKSQEEDLKQEILILKNQLSTVQKVLSQEKETLNKKLEETKIILQEERIKYESKILELTDGIEFNKGELFQAPDLFIKKEMKAQQLQNSEQIHYYLEDLHKKIDKLQQQQDQVLQARIEIEQEKVYLQASTDLKDQLNNQIERMKLSFEGEIKVLKEDRARLQEQREQLQINLVEKDCEVQILKAKLKHMEKQKSKDIEHADMLCRLSDQLVRAIKKLDQK